VPWIGFTLHRTTAKAISRDKDFDAKTNFSIHNYLLELRQRQNRNDAD
jgi:hypothetical protein